MSDEGLLTVRLYEHHEARARVEGEWGWGWADTGGELRIERLNTTITADVRA